MEAADRHTVEYLAAVAEEERLERGLVESYNQLGNPYRSQA
jgi:hypothetical protein